MYNPDVKNSFLNQLTNAYSIERFTSIFSASEPYETKNAKDLYEFSEEELSPVIRVISGVKTSSRRTQICNVRRYIKWCKQNDIACVSDAIFTLDYNDTETIKTKWVSGPLQLQNYLDQICAPESERTISDIYRCYLWLAFSGMPEDEAVNITASDVDLLTLIVWSNGKRYNIYREGVMAFSNCVNQDSFRYTHPLYFQTVDRKRVEGELLLRGIKTQPKALAFKTELVKRNARAIEENKTTLKLSYNTVRDSGLFYEVYERKTAQQVVDTRKYVMKALLEKLGDEVSRYTIRQLVNDYFKWKQAFR